MSIDKTMHFGPYEVKLSNQDKIIFSQHKLTKADVLEYYLDIGDQILPWLKDRPLTLHRFPDGVEASGFY